MQAGGFTVVRQSATKPGRGPYLEVRRAALGFGIYLSVYSFEFDLFFRKGLIYRRLASTSLATIAQNGLELLIFLPRSQFCARYEFGFGS